MNPRKAHPNLEESVIHPDPTFRPPAATPHRGVVKSQVEEIQALVFRFQERSFQWKFQSPKTNTSN